MDRRGILYLILAAALFAAWQFYYIRKTQEHARAVREAEAAAAAAEAANPKPLPADPPQSAVAPAPSVPPVIEATTAEKLDRLSTPIAEYSFTNLGGGIRSAQLSEHFAFNGHRVVLNQFGAIPIGAISGAAGEATAQPFTTIIDSTAGTATFERTDERKVKVTKRFSMPKLDGLKSRERLREEFLLTLDVSFTNGGDQPFDVPTYWVHTGSAAPIHQGDQPIYTGFNFFRGSSNKFIPVTWFQPGGFLFFKTAGKSVYPEQPETLSDVRWAGVTNQYYTTLITPLVDEKAMSDVQTKQRGVGVWAKQFFIDDTKWRAAGHAETDAGERLGIDGALAMNGFKLDPGQTETRRFHLYAGPREYRRLRELGNYEAEIMDFGIFGIVSKTLLNSMNWLKGMLSSYALAIVVLTLVIKTAMWPLQNKATASMKKMQALQPKMTELRDKYKDDPQKMNSEVMRLYKEYGVNPFGGCLPMLIQIPIFFGFYNMLGKAVELRNAKFLWVQDLSQPDTIFHLIGLPVNVLPLLMAVTMLWSMALQPKSGDPMQQRIFMFVPLIFIFFCYNFASALALYWTVQNLFSIVQLYLTRDQVAPTLQKVAAPKLKR